MIKFFQFQGFDSIEKKVFRYKRLSLFITTEIYVIYFSRY
jgi:hypothetical protein